MEILISHFTTTYVNTTTSVLLIFTQTSFFCIDSKARVSGALEDKQFKDHIT